MPSVASEALPPTYKSAAPPSPRPSQPAGDNAAPAPFESLLDDTQQAAAPPPPPPSQPPASSNTQNSADAQPSKPPAPSKDAKPAKSTDADATTGKPGKTDKAAKSDKVDAKTIEANAADTKTDGDAKTDDKTDDKSDTKSDAQAAAADSIAQLDANKPAAVNPAAAVLPVAAAPADPTQANANAGASAAPAVATLASATAKIASATKAAPQVAAPKTDTQDKPQLAAQADTDAAAGAAKVAVKAITPAHGDGKPADTEDKPAATPVNGDHAKLDAQLAANGSPTAAAKPDGDAMQQLAMNAPAQQAAPSAATDASAPAQPLAQPPAAPAVPLAGVAIEIAGKAAAGKNHFDIRLDPPELGRIEVRLDVGRDGSISSHVIADRKDTLDLLQRDASGLQRAFEDAGLKTSDNGMQFSLRNQFSGQQQNSPNSNAAPLVVEDDTPITPLAINYSRLADARGGLDIRV